MFKAKLINIAGQNDDDFEPGDHALLLEVERKGELVTVDCVAVIGDNPKGAYYDITLPSGVEIEAISGHHLADIENFTTMTHESQFVMTIKHQEHFDPVAQGVDIQAMLRDALQNENISISFETTYPL